MLKKVLLVRTLVQTRIRHQALVTFPRAAFAAKKPDPMPASVPDKKADAPKKRGRKPKTEEPKVAEEPAKKQSLRLYTLKFNSPILPFAKFPLTQNKYIQDFLRKYEEDKEHVQRIIGVHFPNNNNQAAEGAVGILSRFSWG